MRKIKKQQTALGGKTNKKQNVKLRTTKVFPSIGFGVHVGYEPPKRQEITK